ncbi:MAG: branched-chain alpha-keto acid dehydrogenase subunit E2, partial [Gammaproteobacteria bacterium]|nr:branched-chain alpha-keto acid dehydrogenase subunit E2 [Gammaproteobacteria bacterium]
HLHACWLNVPHVTQFDEADITTLEAFRQSNREDAEKRGVRLTPLVFIMKAVVAVLREFPQFNSSLDSENGQLIIKHYYNIGVAVDTPNGLMVPVVKGVDSKGVYDLAAELMEISSRARDGKLGAADLQGGTFSISSLGGIGGTQFTPIVNVPEVAILGVARSQMKPVWNGTDFEPRLMLPLALSYDHRVVDGADGARFVTRLSQLLNEYCKVLL